MSAEIIDISRKWRYASAAPTAPDPAETARIEAVLKEADRKNVALAKRKALAPLKPTKPQEPCDVGLFSDDARQLDLTDKRR